MGLFSQFSSVPCGEEETVVSVVWGEAGSRDFLNCNLFARSLSTPSGMEMGVSSSCSAVVCVCVCKRERLIVLRQKKTEQLF